MKKNDSITPQNESEIVDSINKIQDDIVEKESESIKKKRNYTKRKTKAEIEEELDNDLQTQAKGILLFTSKFLEKRLGQKWAMSETEIQTGIVAVSGMMKKYFAVFGQYSIEVMFTTWILGYTIPRMDFKKKQTKSSNEE